MQRGDHLSLPPVGLHPIPAPLGDHRRTHHHARLSAFRQVPIDAEAARTGLVDEVELPVRRTPRAHAFVQRLKIARDDPVVATFSITLPLSDRDVNRFFVDIQPYEHATVLHDLPPRVWLGVTPSDATPPPPCTGTVGLCFPGAISARPRAAGGAQ